MSGTIEPATVASDAGRSIVRELTRIEDATLQHPETVEIAITELHTLLRKFDPVAKATPAQYPLVAAGFDPDAVLQQIREISKQPTLKITQIRFKADELAKLKKIGLPKGTMHHRDSLLQWYKIHWDALVDGIREWGDPSEAGSEDD
jgi:hypothetical protein